MGLFFTVLPVLYVVSAYTPQYRINKRLVQGKQFNEFAFIGNLFEAFNNNVKTDSPLEPVLGCMAALFIFSCMCWLMPFVVMYNFYRNWTHLGDRAEPPPGEEENDYYDRRDRQEVGERPDRRRSWHDHPDD